MTKVADASAVLRALLPGPDADAATETLDDALVAPSLVLAEIANALWKYVKAGELPAEAASALLAEVPRLFDRLDDEASLVDEALALAVAVGHPVYDCLYLVLARREGAPLLTADRRLAKLAEQLDLTVERQA